MIRAKKRLDHEYESFPLDYIKVNFKKETFLEWHFLFLGQIGTPFEGGEYHGILVFPENYPFSPPSTQIITPNGRFQTDESVCFSINDFHPENWKPAYTMSSFLQGVYSFMMSETTDTVGSLEKDESEIRELAGKSREFNFQDGSAELFQNETKAALTENSDTDPIPSPINNLDIPSSPPDVLCPFVLSKQAKPNTTTVTVGNLGMNTNSKMGLASKGRESTNKVAALIDFFQSQSENVNSPSSENTKHTTRFKSKQSHEIPQPSKSTESADQLILPHPVIGKVINSTVSSDSTSGPSQRSGSNGVNNSKEKQEDNVTSSSEPPEDRKHLPTDTVWILDMGEEEINKLARMSKEFNEHDEAYKKLFKEEIDETIQSSLNNFSANIKREHICTSANGTHDNYNIITTLSSQSTANLNSHWLNRAKKRLLSEFKEISDNPSDNILIEFTEDKFLEWHFLFKGFERSLFEGGEYHGMLEFPENYPFYPPSIQFFTPNGRFKTNERVRFILSDFCPEFSNPSYTVSAVLQVAYAFMMSETTGTVGSLILNENELRNLARMSKEFNRNNDTFNELFIDKVDEDIEYPLDNSDDLIRKKNIERPSDLIPIAVPNTTRLTQSISTHKTNERLPSHLAKVDKKEQVIGQNSSFPANTSRNSFNCPSNSDEGKESHTSKLLDRTLREESKSIHGHNSATRVSQYPERPENVPVRSSDYLINNSRNNYDRDTSDIPKPNKEVSSEKSNDSLSQNTTSNRSMDSSKKSTTDKFSASPPKGSKNAQMPKTDRTPDSLPHAQTGITSVAPNSSKESSLKKFQPNLSYITDTCSANPPKRPENVEIPKTIHILNSLLHDQTGITSVAPDSSKEFTFRKSQPNLSYNTDTCSANPPKRPENVEIPKTIHILNSLLHAQTGTTSVAPDSSKEFSFRKSQPNLSYNTDTYSANPPKRPENVEIPKTGHPPNSLPHAQTGTTSVAPDSSKEFTFRKSQPNLSYNTDSHPHAYSSTNMSFQDACSNNFVSKYVSHLADSQTTDIISRPLNSSTSDRLYHSTSDGLSMKNSSLHVPITSNVYRHVQKKSGNEKRKPPFYPPTSLSTNKHLHNSSNESIKRRLPHPPSSPINNIRQNSNRTIHKSMLDFSKASIPYQTSPATYSNWHHHHNSPANNVLCHGTSDHYSIERSPLELFQRTSRNRSIVRPLPDSFNSSTAAHRESNINQSHSLTSAKSSFRRNTSGSIGMDTFPSHHSTSSASNMLARSTSSIKSAKRPPISHPPSSATDRLLQKVSTNKCIVTPPLDSPVSSTNGRLTKNTSRNRPTTKSSNQLATSSTRNRKNQYTRDYKPNLSSSHSDISLCKRQQYYRTIRPILPHDTQCSLSATNCKTPKYTDPIKGYKFPSSPTSRSLNDKLKLQPNTSFRPKLTKSEDLDFNCGRKNALPGNIDSNLCLKKTTKISKSLETDKELPTYGSSVLSRNNYTDQSIANKDTVTNAALKGSLGRSNERLAKSEIDKKILKVKIDTDVLLKSNESKIESRKLHGFWK